MHNPVLSWLHKNKFYSSTPIGGFNFIDKSKSKYEIITWYIVLIVFAGLTFWNVYRLVKQYNDEQTTVKVEMVEATRRFPVIPELYVKIKIPSVMFFKKLIRYFTANVTEQKIIADNYGMWEKDSEICVLIRNIANHSITYGSKESFFDHKHDDPFKVFLIIAFLSVPNRRKASVCNIQNTEMSKNFERFLMKNNVSKSELQRMVLANHLSPVQLYMDQYNIETMSTDVLELPSGRWIYTFHIRFINPVTVSSFSIRMRVDAETEREKSTYMTLYHTDYAVKQTANIGEFIKMKTRAIGVYQSLKANCDHKGPFFGKSGLNCLLRCKILYVRENCNCSLFIPGYYVNDDSLPTCLFHHLERCQQNNRFLAEQCVSLCSVQNPCQTVFYQQTSRRITGRSYENSAKVMYELHSQKYYFPVFTEQEAHSFDSFMGELGGVFDFWLGASVIGLVLVVYMMKQIINGFKKNTKTRYMVKAMLGKFEPSAVIVPAGVTVVKKGAAELSFHEKVEIIKREKNFDQLCAIMEEQFQLLNDKLEDLKI